MNYPQTLHILMLAHAAAPSAVTGRRRGSHHVRGVLGALPQRRPPPAAIVAVDAVAAWRVIGLVERGYTDPFRGEPFLTLDDRAPTMEARRVRHGVWAEVEEQEGVPFPWFHCNAILCTF